MYPLLLKPAVKNYPWGGSRLKTEYGLACDTEIAAEGWMLSCHPDGPSIVANGPYAGMTLPQVLERCGGEALGSHAAAFPYFPLLIKLIDAKQNLSVQVHPSDEYALKHEGEFGKTELWYVVDCEPGAELIYGFTDTVSKEELARRIHDNTLAEICNHVSVQAGDVFFIPAGTLHAIGGGILIAEVQQNSNTTYRVYDYGRVGADGKPRPLHIEKALDVTACDKTTIPYGQIGEVHTHGRNAVRTLARCPLFSTELLTLNETFSLCNANSFVSLVCLNGEATLTYSSERLPIQKGDSIFIPAGVSVIIDGAAELLCSYL